MAVNYATKYAPQVDERFRLGSLTAGIVNQNFDWISAETVKVYSVPVPTLNDYTTTGTNRYGTPSELENSVQDMTLTKDRSFTFTIDKKSADDNTAMVMDAGNALSRTINEVVIPEIDTYRISAIAAGANTANVLSANTISNTNAYENFLSMQELVDDGKAPQIGRVSIVTPAYYNMIKLDPNFVKQSDMGMQLAINGLVGMIDNVAIIKAPTSYFPAFTLAVLTNAIVAPAPVKLQEYKIHTDAPGISGWLVEGRVRYDCFVLNEKKAAISVLKQRAA